jgi:hypothetical protein
MYGRGLFDVNIKAEFHLSNDQFERFKELYPEFRETVTHGKIKAEAHMVSTAMDNLPNREFNTKLFELLMRNGHKWNEKDPQQQNDNTLKIEVVTRLPEKPENT